MDPRWLLLGVAVFLFACSLRFHRRIHEPKNASPGVGAFVDVVAASFLPLLILLSAALDRVREHDPGLVAFLACSIAFATWAVRIVSSVPRIE